MDTRSVFVKKETVLIKENQEYVTLNVVLKLCDIISTGGYAKIYLQENECLVNGEPENRRGRKLYPGDIVETSGITIEIDK